MKMGIRLKSFLWFFSISFIMLVSCVVFMMSKINSINMERTELKIQNTVDENAAKWDSFANNVQNFGYLLSNRSFMQKIYTADKSDSDMEINNILSEVYNDGKLLNGFLNNNRNLNIYVSYIFNDKYAVSDKLFEVSEIKFRFGDCMYSDKNLKNEQWYNETIRKNGKINVFYDNGNDKYIVFAVMSKKAGFSDYAIVSIFSINMDAVLNDFCNIGYEETCGRITDINRNEIIGNMKNIDKEKYLSFTTSTIFGWNVEVAIPKDKIKINYSEISVEIIIYIFLAFLAAVILSAFFGYKNSQPVLYLANKMKQINQNEVYDMRLEKKGLSKEIYELYSSFNILLDRISWLMKDIEHSESEKHSIEMKMFQYQINPHMIYNVLDAISWKALIFGCDDIANMNSLMADILRYSTSGEDCMAYVWEEIETVKKYLKIQEFIYEKPIALECDISESDRKIEIPKCCMQILVENAVIHVGAVMKKPLIIKIYVQENPKRIVIGDNGNENSADLINGILSGNIKSNGLGIKNVNARMKLYFGEEYGLKAALNESGGTDMQLFIP